MYCKSCGAKIPDNAKFCTECGKSVVNKESIKTKSNFWSAIIVGAVIAVAIILISSVVNPADKVTVKPKKPAVINPIEGDAFDCHVKYLRYEIVDESNPRIMVYYSFTNNSEKNSRYYFDFCTTSEAYQDGAMLKFYFGDSPEEKDKKTEIKPGTTITVCEGYYLRNLTSPVDVTLKEYVPLFLPEIGTMTIPLS